MELKKIIPLRKGFFSFLPSVQAQYFRNLLITEQSLHECYNWKTATYFHESAAHALLLGLQKLNCSVCVYRHSFHIMLYIALAYISLNTSFKKLHHPYIIKIPKYFQLLNNWQHRIHIHEVVNMLRDKNSKSHFCLFEKSI